MTSTQFSYYDHKISKEIPCFLVKGSLFVKTEMQSLLSDKYLSKTYYCNIVIDESRLEACDLTMAQVYKYCNRIVNINELYPMTSVDEVSYFHNCISNLEINISTELSRFEKIIYELTDVPELEESVFYDLCSFVSYELLFKFLTHDQRVFYRMLSMTVLNTVPDVIHVPEMIRMTKRLFDKYSGSLNSEHEMYNYLNYEEFQMYFPIVLYVNNIRQNVNFLANYC